MEAILEHPSERTPANTRRPKQQASAREEVVEEAIEEVADEVEEETQLVPAPRQKPAARARYSAPPPPSARGLSRHARKCIICRHPEREEIEAEFIEWQHPYDIGHDHGVDMRVVYRHARAVGLYARRNRNVRTALEALLQHCYDAKVTGDTIVRAVRAYTRITDDGRWIDPPPRVIVSSGSRADAKRIGTPSERSEPSDLLTLDAAPVSAPPLLAAASQVSKVRRGPASKTRKPRRGPRPKKRSSNRHRRPIRK